MQVELLGHSNVKGFLDENLRLRPSRRNSELYSTVR